MELLFFKNKYRLESLQERYNAKYRHFHNWSHITDVYDTATSMLSDLDMNMTIELELAILFHDYYYDPLRKDNEKRSCVLFAGYYTYWIGEDIPTADRISVIDRVTKLIMYTKNHDVPDDDIEGQILVKADMDILLRPDIKQLLIYEDKIFKEYQEVDLDVYIKGRTEFLARFISQFHDDLTTGEIDSIKYLMKYVEHRVYNIGVYIGSFHPFHIGHMNIIEQSEKIFDKVIIAQGNNPDKPKSDKYKIPRTGRYQMKYSETVIQLMLQMKHMHSNSKITLIRGIRNAVDMAEEDTFRKWVIELLNLKCRLGTEINFIYLLADPNMAHISSSALRSIDENMSAIYGINSWLVKDCIQNEESSFERFKTCSE